MICGCGPDWSAVLDKQPIEKPRLTVTGTAECSIYANDPELRPLRSQGINPTELLLELVCTEKPHSGESSDAIVQRKVTYHHANSSDYQQVVIVNCDHKRIKVEIIE